MTSDTKIGLLLGLVFIFVIAFVINGLPGFDRAQSPNQLTYNLANYQDATPDLGARELNARRYMEPYNPFGTEVRDQMVLPAVDPAVQDQASSVLKEMEEPHFLGMNPNLMQKQQAEKVAAWPKVCEVRPSDNLAKIAKRYYGPENGNKAASIQRIFEANRDILSSPNAVIVGQQLIIPALTPLDSISIEEITVPVKSVGTPVPVAAKANDVWYTVKEEDSLWKIAVSELGSGGRYSEIAKLNASILSDENSVKPGMRLKLPTP